MLFNEPKLLKFDRAQIVDNVAVGFSALQRAEIAEIRLDPALVQARADVSVLFNEPKLLKSYPDCGWW